MKKIIFALAIIAMLAFVACQPAAPAEQPEVKEIVVDEPAKEPAPADEPVVEEPAEYDDLRNADDTFDAIDNAMNYYQ